MRIASDIAKHKGPIFVSSLAGRIVNKADVTAFDTEAQLWRHAAIRRASMQALATVGLTPHRFQTLLKNRRKTHPEVRQLEEAWLNYFDSKEYRRKWNSAVNPFLRSREAPKS